MFVLNVKSDSPTPTNLTATYKSPSTVLLEWMFSDPVVGDTTYTVYYQSGGVSYNTSFTLTRDQKSYLMMDLPLEVITNVFILTVTKINRGNYLPSPVVGPAAGMCNCQLLWCYSDNIITVIAESPEVVVSVEGSGVAGTSYTLTCTVTLPSGVAMPDSIDIQWLGLSTPQHEMISPGVYTATLDIMLQNISRFTCAASYTVNGVSSKLVHDSLDIG